MAPPTSLRSLLAYAGSLFTQAPMQLTHFSNPFSLLGSSNPTHHAPDSASVMPYIPLSGAPSCPVDSPISCQNSSQADSCCFVSPGGRLLLTQFWDEKVHVGGGEEDWTVHGLWPDLCDGSYDSYCGMAPRFNNITDILEHYGQDELLDFMNRYWIANYGGNAHLWAHEYNKHATCINTLAPSCYGDDYKPGMEVVDYFVRAAGLFRMLDTFRALQMVGIEPDYVEKYARTDVEEALQEFSGGRVILRCIGMHHDILHEVWYVYFVKGSLQSGEFVPAKQDSDLRDPGNCASSIRYLPKRGRH